MGAGAGRATGVDAVSSLRMVSIRKTNKRRKKTERKRGYCLPAGAGAGGGTGAGAGAGMGARRATGADASSSLRMVSIRKTNKRRKEIEERRGYYLPAGAGARGGADAGTGAGAGAGRVTGADAGSGVTSIHELVGRKRSKG